MGVDLVNVISQIPVTAFLDYLGVFVGVLAGSLFAIERKLDVVGVVSFGLIVGFGGGILRDLLLQDQGIFFMEYPEAVIGSMLVSIAMSMGRRHMKNFYQHLFYVDAFEMAWYALAGAVKSWYGGANIIMSIILGSVTAVGGGALRDICSGQIPKVFQPGKFYAISSFVGSACYVVPVALGAPENVASVLCVVVGFGLTVLSERFNWHTNGGSGLPASQKDSEHK